jgi:hypothetical protein
LPRLWKSKNSAPLIDLEPAPSTIPENKAVQEDETDSPQPLLDCDPGLKLDQKLFVEIPVQDQIIDKAIQESEERKVSDVNVPQTTQEIEPKLNILGFEVIDKSPPKSPQINQPWDIKQTNSLELLTPSPLGFTPFDSRSMDELMTPDDFGSDLVRLSNINYDIDLSDFSGDNSVADDAPKEAKDPFSPEGLKTFDPFAPQTSSASTFSEILEKFDEFSLTAGRNQSSDPFEVVHRHDPFSPPGLSVNMPQSSENTFSPDQKAVSILDDSNSPTSICLLPSPLLPQSSNKP